MSWINSISSQVKSHQVENMLNLTWIELKMWVTQLQIELNLKCQLETWLDDQFNQYALSISWVILLTVIASCNCSFCTLNNSDLCMSLKQLFTFMMMIRVFLNIIWLIIKIAIVITSLSFNAVLNTVFKWKNSFNVYMHTFNI